MAQTAQGPGWTSQFRELVLEVDANLYDIRNAGPPAAALLDPDDYAASQAFAAGLRAAGSQGIAYPSVRGDGDCAGLFHPDLARGPTQGRHLDYHWDGTAVDLIRDAGVGAVFRVV